MERLDGLAGEALGNEGGSEEKERNKRGGGGEKRGRWKQKKIRSQMREGVAQ